MSRPIDQVLGRLEKPKPIGRDRWRSACPACGGNRSALSIGIAQNDAVLLRCWKGCSIEEIAAGLGLDVSDLFPPRDANAARPRKIGMLTATQALDLLSHESQVVAIVASDIGRGAAISEADRGRVIQAAARIAYLCDEVRA